LALTVLVRGSLHPLSRRQAANAARMQEKMAKLAPELKQLKEKHKGDLRSLQQAQMELYRKHGVNPLAMMGGCLLLILQMPIFMGLYFALQESIFFRLESFLWVPNLAAPDMLIRWGESIPWISAPESKGGLLYLGPYFNLLPIVAVALMLIQQKMLMPPPADEQQAAQQKMMKFMMILIGFLFYKIAAGICIYFIASTLWGVAERKLLPKHKPGAAAAEPAGAGKGAPDRGGPPQAGNGKRRKRKGGKPGKPSPKGPAEPESLGGKLKAWWEDILEKAKKK
ncbi:MAG TPA: YidC/Oxa1 family membrane protein insertase, partial [Gemmataceae bacterium]